MRNLSKIFLRSFENVGPELNCICCYVVPMTNEFTLIQ